eukprot:6202970-Pleurochrysis_carterae.AAC.1
MFLVASLHYRSGRILMYGWTMLYKWGHPVVTLPATNGTIRYTRRMTEIMRIITPSSGTNPICRDVGHVRQCSRGHWHWQPRAPSAAGVQRMISTFTLMYAQIEYAR